MRNVIQGISIASIAAALVCVAAAAPAAQWLKQPTAGIPRTADGKADLSAPAPRMRDGKPDLSGLWQPAAILIGDIAANFRPTRCRTSPGRKRSSRSGSPTTAATIRLPTASLAACPVPTSGLSVQDSAAEDHVVILYEAVHSYRQIFADGRSLPGGHESRRGSAIPSESGRRTRSSSRPSGFNDKVWLDNFGSPATDKLRVTERFVRKDFGHMDLDITIDDPRAYTKPWDVTLPLVLRPDTELLEYICNENNKYFEIIPKAAASTEI